MRDTIIEMIKRVGPMSYGEILKALNCENDELAKTIFEMEENDIFKVGKLYHLIDGTSYAKGTIVIRNDKSGEKIRLDLDGMFVAIGQVPENEPFKNLAELSDRGYIISDEECLTSTEGLFTAGDCRTKRIRQIATACGDGATAALAACRYLDN